VQFSRESVTLRRQLLRRVRLQRGASRLIKRRQRRLSALVFCMWQGLQKQSSIQIGAIRLLVCCVDEITHNISFLNHANHRYNVAHLTIGPGTSAGSPVGSTARWVGAVTVAQLRDSVYAYPWWSITPPSTHAFATGAHSQEVSARMAPGNAAPGGSTEGGKEGSLASGCKAAEALGGSHRQVQDRSDLGCA
jgi:hypothetical protein